VGLFKRDDSPYWWYEFSRKGIGRVRESTGIEATEANRQDAEQAEAKRKRDLWEQARLGVKPKHTWNEAVVEYLDEMPENRTKRVTRSILRWLDPHLSGLMIEAIDTDKLIAIRRAKVAAVNKKKAALVAAGRPSRWAEAQPSTINRVLGVVGAVLNFVKDERTWLDRVPKMPLLTVEEKEPLFATREKALRLIANLPRHQIPMVIYDLEVGWRKSNVTHLAWPQVDLDRCFAWVSPEDAKAGTGIPTPLSEVAVDVLRGQVGLHDHWVFPYRGKPIEQTTTKAFRRARDAAGLPPAFTWHALRHTWASWQAQGGMPRHVLKELGGWKTDKMVAHYAHLGGEHLRQYVRSQLEGVATKSPTVENSGAKKKVSKQLK
jgi:integrase